MNRKKTRREIEVQAPSFGNLIESVLIESDMLDFIKYYSKRTEVYVFSGVIRDFLLGNPLRSAASRDYDFVIAGFRNIGFPTIDKTQCLVEYNKFGGVKIRRGGFVFDIWGLEDTWGIVNKKISKPTVNSLLNTTFFNFSSIVFDYNKCKFLMGDNFCEFYDSHVMDIVYQVNPHPESCIVSSFYYANNFKFHIGDNLKKWIVKYYSKDIDYKTVQIKRFGKVLFEDKIIEQMIAEL